MSRSIKTPSSLELLLDAMCNVFGAVLFMAILFGGLSITREIAEDAETVKPEQVKKAESELKLLETRLRTIQMEHDLLAPLAVDKTTSSLTADPSLARRCMAAAGRVNSLADRLQVLQKQYEQYQRTDAEIERCIRQPDSRKELQKQIAILEKKLVENILPPTETPMQHRTSELQPWRILVTGNAVYPIGSNADIRGRSSQLQVNIKYLRINKNDFYYITRKPGSGIQLEHLDVRKILPPEGGYFVEMLVEPAAVSIAAQLLRVLREQKLFYHWRIVPEAGALLRSQEGGGYEVSR